MASLTSRQQTLFGHAKRIAQEYPKRYRYTYLRAAETLRAPYWDWGFDSNVPEATTTETIVVNIPNGEELVPTEIQNPLSTYRFPMEALDNRFGLFDSENRSQIYRCDDWPKSYPLSADEAMADRPYKSWLVSCRRRSCGSRLTPSSTTFLRCRKTFPISLRLQMEA